MFVTYIYMSVLIQSMTQTKYTGTVETLKDILSHKLTPLMYHKSGLIEEYLNSNYDFKRQIAEDHQGFKDDSEAVR